MNSKIIIALIVGIIVIIGIGFGMSNSENDNFEEKGDVKQEIDENDQGKQFSIKLSDSVTAAGP